MKAVRDRAGIKTKDISEYDQASFRELIRNERGRELCFESLRKYDLIRWGIYVEEMNNYTKSYIDFIFGTEAMRKTLKSIDFLYGFAHTEKVMESVNGVPINGTAGVWKYSDHYPVVAEFSIYK